jgi:hypothetical protein
MFFLVFRRTCVSEWGHGRHIVFLLWKNRTYWWEKRERDRATMDRAMGTSPKIYKIDNISSLDT